MKGVYLTFISSSEGQRKLLPRVEEHVRWLIDIQRNMRYRLLLKMQVILPELTEIDVLVQVKACGLSRVNVKVRPAGATSY